jgi:hypothetical protein
MDDSEKLQNIIEGNKELTKKVDELSRAISEDAHAYSIYSKARDSFKKWLGMWLGFLTLFLAAIGITSYYQAVDKLSKSKFVTDSLIHSVSPKIEKAALEELKQKISTQITKNDAILDQQLANIRAKAEDRMVRITEDLNSKIKTISEKINTKISPLETQAYKVSSGYAFYGIRSNGSWDSRHFKIVGDAPAEPPKPGDTLEATSNVNIREDYITFGITGWNNAPTLGVVKPHDILDVLEVKEVVSGYYWIKFKNRRPAKE